MFDWFERGLDIALVITMAYFFLRGIFRGVVKEIVAVLGIFVAFWVASVYYPLGAEHLKPIFEYPGHRGFVSFTMIFVIVYFLIGVISIFVDKIVKITISPIVSSLLGAIVGLSKGVLFCAVLMSGVDIFIKPTEKFFTNSELWPYLQPVSQRAREVIPEALRKMMSAKRDQPTVSNRQPKGNQADNNNSEGRVSLPEMVNLDWPAIKNIMATRPGEIAPAWRDKLRSIPNGQSLNDVDIQRFITEHPALFSKAPASPPGVADNPDETSAPSWPQPAE